MLARKVTKLQHWHQDFLNIFQHTNNSCLNKKVKSFSLLFTSKEKKKINLSE